MLDLLCLYIIFLREVEKAEVAFALHVLLCVWWGVYMCMHAKKEGMFNNVHVCGCEKVFGIMCHCWLVTN